MKVVILAGGYPSRLDDMGDLKPKPMIRIGDRPLVWHIMKYFAHFGLNEFVVAVGAEGDFIKKYMLDFCTIGSDVRVDFARGTLEQNNRIELGWRVEVVDTGVKTQTGGRLKRLAPFLGQGKFILTWGDCLSNIDVRAFEAMHERRGRLATLVAVRPPARFGRVEIDDDYVVNFGVERTLGQGWINGSIFILEPGVLDYIDDDRTHLEGKPLADLSRDYQLIAYRHKSFWQCLDTMRDKRFLDRLWESGNAPWKVWSSPISHGSTVCQ